jgi:hypothetical protein
VSDRGIVSFASVSNAQDVAEDAMAYIVEGGQICYGSKRAWETCRDC